MENLADTIKTLLEDIHNNLFEQAKARRDAHITQATDFETFKQGVNGGFVEAMWCGERDCEDAIKAETAPPPAACPLASTSAFRTCVCTAAGLPSA